MTVLVSVEVKMPSESGRYRGYYRLAKPSSNSSSAPTPFGHNLWIEATVAPKINPPAPSPSLPVSRPVLPVIDATKSTVTIPTPSTPSKPVDMPKPPQQQQQQQQQQQPQQQQQAPVNPIENKVIVEKAVEAPKIEKKEEPYTGPYANEVQTIRKMGFEEPTELILRLLASANQNKRARISPVDWVVHKLVEKRY